MNTPKNRYHINYGPYVATLMAQCTEHFHGLVFTAYVDNISVRSHQLHNQAVRDDFIEAVSAILGGADGDFRSKLDSIIEQEVSAIPA